MDRLLQAGLLCARLLAHGELELIHTQLPLLVAQGPAAREGDVVRRRDVDPRRKILHAERASARERKVCTRYDGRGAEILHTEG